MTTNRALRMMVAAIALAFGVGQLSRGPDPVDQDESDSIWDLKIDLWSYQRRFGKNPRSMCVHLALAAPDVPYIATRNHT
jgi:hypothetical protein